MSSRLSSRQVIKPFNLNIHFVVGTMASRSHQPSTSTRHVTPAPQSGPGCTHISCYGESRIHFPKWIKRCYELYSAILDSLIVFSIKFVPQTEKQDGIPQFDLSLTHYSKERICYTEATEIESKRRFGAFIRLTSLWTPVSSIRGDGIRRNHLVKIPRFKCVKTQD